MKKIFVQRGNLLIYFSPCEGYIAPPPYMDKQKFDDQLEPINNSSVLIQDVAWRTSRERWTIEMGGESGSGKFVLA